MRRNIFLRESDRPGLFCHGPRKRTIQVTLPKWSKTGGAPTGWPAVAGHDTQGKSLERQMRKKNPHIGSTLTSFLKEEGILEEVTLRAIKSVLAWRISEMMKKQRITKSQMAKRIRTSRAAVDRLLDAANTSVTLQTMGRAAAVLGKELTIGLRDAA